MRADERMFLDAAAKVLRDVATVHERVACPKCNAQRGEPCRAMPHGYRIAPMGRRLKHPHAERLRADGIPDR